MPRPMKRRRVCCLPKVAEFMPKGHKNKEEYVILTVDEYETIRLIDKEGLSQEECGIYMHIARTTVQQIYMSARQKLAIALVDAIPMKIEGGNYQLCNGKEEMCQCRGCGKYRNECM